MKFNGKKFCVLSENNILVEENVIHWYGYLNKKDSKKRINPQWDNDSHQTVLYRDGDELLSVSRHRRKWERVNVFPPARCDIGYDHEEGLKITDASYPPHSLIHHSIHRGVTSKIKIGEFKVNKNMSKEYAKRYKNDPKLKNTWVHFEAVRKSESNYLMTVDDVPDCHLLIPYDYLRVAREDPTSFYSQDWNRFRNIAPYKSNLVDSARNFLDKFDARTLQEGHQDLLRQETSWRERWDNSVFDVYKKDKKIIWEYLDKGVFTEYEGIPRELKKYGIDFEYFDLDKDSYKKTFEIDKDPLFRLMTYNTMDQLKNFPTKEVRDRYHRLTDIAKEYVAQCGREDNRITL